MSICDPVWENRAYRLFALRMLRIIADRTTPRSGVPSKLARKNLLQQLSVALWQSNAKMILRYWALLDNDDDNNPLFLD